MPIPIRIHLVNRLYPPNGEASSQVAFDLAQQLAKSFSVLVSCCVRDGRTDGQSGSQRVRRFALPLQGKKSIIAKLIQYPLSLAALTWSVIRTEKDAIVLLWSDPPLLDMVGGFLCWLTGRKYIVVGQDLFLLYLMRKFFWLRPLRPLQLFAYRRARRIVCISEDSRRILQDAGLSNLEVIPNWASSPDMLQGEAAPDWRSRYGGSTVFKYAGNTGFAFDFGFLKAAVERLVSREVDQVVIVLQVSGRRAQDLKQFAAQYPHLVKIAPRVPLESLGSSLRECDAHMVISPPGVCGIVFPSKLYTAMAVGRPIVAAGAANSEIHRLILENRLGYSIDINRPEQFADALVELHHLRVSQPEKLEQMGNNGSEYAHSTWSLEKASAAYAELIRNVAGGAS